MAKLNQNNQAKGDKIEKEPLISDDGPPQQNVTDTKKSTSSDHHDKAELFWKMISITVMALSFYCTYSLKVFDDWKSENLKTYARFSDMTYVVSLSLLIYFIRSMFRMMLYVPIYNALGDR